MIHFGSREIEEDKTFKPAETDHFQIGVDTVTCPTSSPALVFSLPTSKQTVVHEHESGGARAIISCKMWSSTLVKVFILSTPRRG
jgi:hypothetical protein